MKKCAYNGLKLGQNLVKRKKDPNQVQWLE